MTSYVCPGARSFLFGGVVVVLLIGIGELHGRRAVRQRWDAAMHCRDDPGEPAVYGATADSQLEDAGVGSDYAVGRPGAGDRLNMEGRTGADGEYDILDGNDRLSFKGFVNSVLCPLQRLLPSGGL